MASTANTTRLTSTKFTKFTGRDPVLKRSPATLPFRSIASLIAERKGFIILTEIVVAISPLVLHWVIEMVLWCDVYTTAYAAALIIVSSVTSDTSTGPASHKAFGTGPTMQPTIPGAKNPNVPKAALHHSHVAPWMPCSQTFPCVEKEPYRRQPCGESQVQGKRLLWGQCIITSAKLQPWHQRYSERWTLEPRNVSANRQCFGRTARLQANLHVLWPAAVWESFLDKGRRTYVVNTGPVPMSRSTEATNRLYRHIKAKQDPSRTRNKFNSFSVPMSSLSLPFGATVPHVG